MTVVKVSEESTRAEIEAAIAALRSKQQRMPTHWVERRAAVGDEIDALVGQWLAAGA